MGFAYNYLEDGDAAEDIVQEVFSTVWSKASEIDIRTNLKSYLFGAVRNACLNVLKHRKVVDSHEKEVGGIESFLDVDFLEMDELQSKVNEALEALPEKRRQIFEMSRYEGKKYHEIAAELDISIKTVETQMGRTLRHLREILGPYLTFLLAVGILLVNVCRGKI